MGAPNVTSRAGDLAEGQFLMLDCAGPEDGWLEVLEVLERTDRDGVVEVLVMPVDRRSGSEVLRFDADDEVRVADELDVTEQELADALGALVEDGGLAEALAEVLGVAEDAVPDLGPDGITSFAGAGLLTRDAGIVLRLEDGAEYQITVVRSR